MKKPLLTLILSGALLLSCTGTDASSTASTTTGTTSSSDTTSSVKDDTSSSASSSTSEVKKYNVIAETDEGSTVTFYNDITSYEAGDIVIFTAKSSSTRYQLISLSINDNFISLKDNDTYQFVMPRNDVTIKTFSVCLGEAGVDRPLKINEETFPKTTSDLLALLNSQKSLNETYTNNIHTSLTGSKQINHVETATFYYQGGYSETFTNTIESDGSNLADHSIFTKTVRGLVNEDTYGFTYTNTGSYLGDTSGSASEDIDITKFDEENALEAFKEDLFQDHFMDQIADYLWTPNEDEVKVTPSTFLDKYTVTYTYDVEDYYGDKTTYQIDATFDGLNYLTSLTFNGVKKEETVLSFMYYAVRAYKPYKSDTLDPYDYVMQQYEIEVDYIQEGDWNRKPSTNGVEVGSTLYFRFVSHDEHQYLLTPTFKAASDPSAIEVKPNGDIVLLKEGMVTLTFDNGLGEERDVTINGIKASPISLNVNLSTDTLFLGQSATATVKITPSLASQKVLVTKDDTSAGDATITDNNDGTFTILSTKIGTLNLTFTSEEKPTLTVSRTITIKEAPTKEKVLETLSTHTLTWDDDYYYAIAINFNNDGTGTYRSSDQLDWSSYEFTYGPVVNFTYTLDENTLEMTLDFQGYDFSDENFEIIGFKVIDNQNFQMTYYDSSYYSDETVDLVVGSRIDLSTL